jgi:mono/diheme cytochrome c family protein
MCDRYLRVGCVLGLRLAAAMAGLLAASVSAGADVVAGKARFNAVCAECHDSADFEGENIGALEATLKRISSGEIKHKKTLTLSDRDVADIAAYMASGGK